jgi:alkylation response protein AidB-like acyl-CoA dehydrogenase
MDFSIPAATEARLQRLRDFLAREVYPHETRWLHAGFAHSRPELDSLRELVKREGLWGPQLPKELGGLGLSLVEHGLVSEVLGRSPFGHYLFGCQAPDAGNLELLHKFGSPAQRERFLEPLARGEIRSCFSMTEPNTPGSNPTQLACTATRDGDFYVIEGRKWFTSSADGAAFAIVMAVTQPEAPPHLRASMIIVPTDTPGFHRLRNIPIMGDPGEGYFSHAEIVYENCRVPVENRLGEEGQGFALAQERLGPGRIHHCMRWLGVAERSFDLLCARAQARHIDEQRLAAKQLTQANISELRAALNAARWMVLHAAWTIDQRGFHAAQEEISLIKFHVAGVMLDTIDRAIQAHGALGITGDTVLAFFYAHERGARIYDGPDEVHKLSAAKRILRRYS